MNIKASNDYERDKTSMLGAILALLISINIAVITYALKTITSQGEMLARQDEKNKNNEAEFIKVWAVITKQDEEIKQLTKRK